MFDYVEDKAFLSRMRNLCGEIMQDCCHYLKEDYDIGAIFYLVGSGAKNLIVQNASLSIDLDYNLEIVRCEDFEDRINLKECARKSFNKALNERDLGDCEDSTSSLTTKFILLEEILPSFQWMSALYAEIQRKIFTDLFTKKQGSLIGMNTIGTKPLIPQEYRKRLSILRKGENGSLSERSI